CKSLVGINRNVIEWDASCNKFQPKLLLNSSEERRPRKSRRRSTAEDLLVISRCLKHGALALISYLPFQREIVVARKPCVVYNVAVQNVFRQESDQFRHGQTLTYELAPSSVEPSQAEHARWAA